MLRDLNKRDLKKRDLDKKALNKEALNKKEWMLGFIRGGELGILFHYIVTIAASLYLGDGIYYPSNFLLDFNLRNDLKSVVLQGTAMFVIGGFLCLIRKKTLEMDFSILKETIIMAFATFVIFLTASWLVGGFGYFQVMLLFGVVFCSYFIMLLVKIDYWYFQVTRLKKKLKEVQSYEE